MQPPGDAIMAIGVLWGLGMDSAHIMDSGAR
jgi:hypothetical protein